VIRSLNRIELRSLSAPAADEPHLLRADGVELVGVPDRGDMETVKRVGSAAS